MELLPVLTYTHLWAGSNGELYAKDRHGNFRLKKRIKQKDGWYFCVTYRYSGGRCRSYHKIKIAIAETFKSRTSPQHYHVLVKDGDENNTVPGNVYWGTHQDSEADKKFHRANGVGNVRPAVKDM